MASRRKRADKPDPRKKPKPSRAALKKAPAKRKAAPKKKAPARKAPARKAPARKAPAKRKAAPKKKAPARRAPARRKAAPRKKAAEPQLPPVPTRAERMAAQARHEEYSRRGKLGWNTRRARAAAAAPKKQAARGAHERASVRTRKTRERVARKLGVEPADIEFSGFKLSPTYEVAGKGYGALAGAFSEMRDYASGGQLLGYLEGRPGVTNIIRWETWGVREGPPPGPVPSDVLARIEDLPLVRRVSSGERAELVETLCELWWDAEEYGADVECEVDYESASGD
jgi:flagellar biosynthesis GTPase FlhF